MNISPLLPVPEGGTAPAQVEKYPIVYLPFLRVHSYTNISMHIPFFPRQQPKLTERKPVMRARLETEIHYSQEGKKYILYGSPSDPLLTSDPQANTPEYFTWLSSLTSFHFSGKEGHFTARKEIRKTKDGTPKGAAYWSAYRRANKKQYRKYLGITEKLTISTLEDTARQLETICISQPPAPKTKRHKPEKREILYARINARDTTIERQEQTIKELEQTITSQEQTIRELKASIHQIKQAQKSKRERMEI
jgi:uncharacterized coiled-coil protein SlyX